jgi:hypothetical protein
VSFGRRGRCADRCVRCDRPPGCHAGDRAWGDGPWEHARRWASFRGPTASRRDPSGEDRRRSKPRCTPPDPAAIALHRADSRPGHRSDRSPGGG